MWRKLSQWIPFQSDPPKKEDDELIDSEKINKVLYQRNFELAIKNKTLSLLSELYEISNLTLHSSDLARKLVANLRPHLSADQVGIFLLDATKKKIVPVAVSSSDATRKYFKPMEDVYARIRLPKKSIKTIFSRVLKTHQSEFVHSFAELFKGVLAPDIIRQFPQDGPLQSAIVYPLESEGESIGVFYVVMSRSYEKLDTHEKEALETIAKVITIALDKSLIYDQLVEVNKHLKDLDVAKSEFMSIASHQLRTPLAGMMGYLSMILSGDYGRVTNGQKEVLNEILGAGQRLTRLVNSFLNATRIEAGRLTINYTKNSFDELIQSVVTELLPTATKKQVSLVYKSKKLPIVEVDVDKIKDVVLNLVDNAIKYSPGGTIIVEGQDMKNGTVRFISRDTGVGIPSGEAAGLFDKFVRGSGIARVEPNGSGLGLFIAKKIIEAHAGKIWAESEGEGKGSVFQFEIPVKKPTSASSSIGSTLATKMAPTTTDTPTRIRKKDRPVISRKKATSSARSTRQKAK